MEQDVCFRIISIEVGEVYFGGGLDLWGAIGGDFGDLLSAVFDFFGVVEDGEFERKMSSLAGLEFGNSAKMPLYAAVVRETGAGFNSGDVSGVQVGGVFPLGQVGKFLQRPRHADASIAGRVVKHDGCFAPAVGPRPEAVDLLDESLGWRAVSGVGVDRLRGVLVEGADFAEGSDQLGAFAKKRRAEVCVVDELEFLIAASAIGE